MTQFPRFLRSFGVIYAVSGEIYAVSGSFTQFDAVSAALALLQKLFVNALYVTFFFRFVGGELAVSDQITDHQFRSAMWLTPVHLHETAYFREMFTVGIVARTALRRPATSSFLLSVLVFRSVFFSSYRPSLIARCGILQIMVYLPFEMAQEL